MRVYQLEGKEQASHYAYPCTRIINSRLRERQRLPSYGNYHRCHYRRLSARPDSYVILPLLPINLIIATQTGTFCSVLTSSPWWTPFFGTLNFPWVRELNYVFGYNVSESQTSSFHQHGSCTVDSGLYCRQIKYSILSSTKTVHFIQRWCNRSDYIVK